MDLKIALQLLFPLIDFIFFPEKPCLMWVCVWVSPDCHSPLPPPHPCVLFRTLCVSRGLTRFGTENKTALTPYCGAHYLWFALVWFSFRSHPPSSSRGAMLWLVQLPAWVPLPHALHPPCQGCIGAAGNHTRRGATPGMHWKGRRGPPPPLHGAQPMPTHVVL